jgi:hypothetical protein
MIETHKLVIIPIDGVVGTDKNFITNLDLSSCGIPNNVHAFQWNNPVWPDKEKSHLQGLTYGQGTGWIEFRSNDHNQNVTELPNWAINAYNVWSEAYIKEQEEIRLRDNPQDN